MGNPTPANVPQAGACNGVVHLPASPSAASRKPPHDGSVNQRPQLSDAELVLVLIKGLFALYHLVREHAAEPRRLPHYLYRYAEQYEDAIVPTAETLYELYESGYLALPQWHSADNPFTIGMGAAESSTTCVRFAWNLHTLLLAFAACPEQVERTLHRLFHYTTRPRSSRILVPLFEVCRRWLAEGEPPSPM